MDIYEFFGGTLNIALLSVFYTVFGALISYLLFHLFEDHTEDWEKSSTAYQFADVCTELSLIGVVAYWTTHFIRDRPPVFPVSRELDRDVDTYISGLFFAFAMFLFLGDLSTKIQFLYNKFLKTHFVKVIPEEWSLLRRLRKTNKNKST